MDDAPLPLPARPCPVCGKPAQPEHRPFCSKRCGLLDLGRWLNGSYRVESEEAPEDAPEDSASDPSEDKPKDG